MVPDLGLVEHNGPLSSQEVLLSPQRRMTHSEHPEQLRGGGRSWGEVSAGLGREKRPEPLPCCVSLDMSLSLFTHMSLCRKRRA